MSSDLNIARFTPLGRRGTMLLWICLACVLCTGCTRPVRSWDLTDPIMYANQYSGCEVAAQDCAYNTGLLLAVWPDGRVLRTESADTIGLRYVLGYPVAEEHERLDSAIGELQQADPRSDRDHAGGIAHHRIFVATADGLNRTWSFAIPVDNARNAAVEELLIAIMQIELANPRHTHWSDLPRFDAPVVGDWRTVRHP